MARLPRLALGGLAHHVLQRGHNAQAVFVDDEDRRAYLSALQEAARAQAVQVHAYALLDNEVQLLLRPGDAAGLSRTMQAAGRRYVAAFNRRHGRSGTLWEGRFRAAVVQPGLPTLQALLLVDGLLPRRGQAPSPQAALWSSAPHRLGLRRDPLVSDPEEFWRLGNTPFEREVAYAALLAQGLDEAELRRIEHAVANGWALGSPEFLAQTAARLGRAVRPRARGRPPAGRTGG
jgi:putative transposase